MLDRAHRPTNPGLRLCAIALALLLEGCPAERSPASLELPNGEPVLRLPVPAGSAVLCQQGNRSPPPQSHSYPNCLHALDLAEPTSQPIDVLAAAPGLVAGVVTGARAGDTMPGHGFGNYVKVRHEHDYFTLYAHLASVSVAKGQRVAAGAVLGRMGDTGKAGTVHVHFSLHRGDPELEHVPDTVPMHGLVAADLNDTSELRLMTGLELVCAPSRISPEGHVYGSELRAGDPPRFGVPPPDLAAAFAASRERLGLAVAKLGAVESILAEQKHLGPRATRERLEELVRSDPSRLEAHYWIAVISLRDLDDVGRAKRGLAVIEAAEPKTPPWIGPWLKVRLGQVAEKEGRLEDALAQYRSASEHRDQGAEFDGMVRAGLDRVSGADTH